MLTPYQAQNVRTVFFNGLGATRVQALRYAVMAFAVSPYTRGGIVYKAQRRHDDTTPEMLFNVMAAADFCDIEIRHLPPNGVAHEERRARRWYHYWLPPDEPEDGVLVFQKRWLDHLTIAGESEIDRGLDDVREALAWKGNFTERKVIIYGFSRGAALALLVAGRLTPEEQEKIAFVVAEAPFDNVVNVAADAIDRLLNYFLPHWWLNFVKRIIAILFNVFVRLWPWWPDGPVDAPIPFGMPVLVASGSDDPVTPVGCQQRIVERMVKLGHTNVTHVVADGADHINIHLSEAFQTALKKMYHKYVV